MKIYTKRCERCGIEFSNRHRVSLYCWERKRFCSRACMGAANAIGRPKKLPPGTCHHWEPCACGNRKVRGARSCRRCWGMNWKPRHLEGVE